MSIDINKYIKEIENSSRCEIMSILKGKRAYNLANLVFDLNNIDEKSIKSSIMIIYKYTPRIHSKLVIKYIIEDSIIGTHFDMKHIPDYLHKYI